LLAGETMTRVKDIDGIPDAQVRAALKEYKLERRP
jgi:hypothetical protein